VRKYMHTRRKRNMQYKSRNEKKGEKRKKEGAYRIEKGGYKESRNNEDLHPEEGGSCQ